MNGPLTRPNNLILASLPDEEYSRLLPYLKRISFKRNELIHGADDLSTGVLFFDSGVASLSISNSDGFQLELSIVGVEGSVGERVIFKHGSFIIRCRMLSDGSAYKLPAEIFEKEFYRCGALHELILNRLESRIMETSQTALCNQLHDAYSRLSRWLLTMADCAHSDELLLTHEVMAGILGLNRPTVSQAAKQLQENNFIKYARGKIKILDRPGMESEACECYALIKETVQNLYNISRRKDVVFRHQRIS